MRLAMGFAHVRASLWDSLMFGRVLEYSTQGMAWQHDRRRTDRILGEHSRAHERLLEHIDFLREARDDPNLAMGSTQYPGARVPVTQYPATFKIALDVNVHAAGQGISFSWES